MVSSLFELGLRESTFNSDWITVLTTDLKSPNLPPDHSYYRLHSLAALTLRTPVDKHCPEEGCHRVLSYKAPLRGVLFTIRNGVIPVLCPSVYCNGKTLL